MFRGFFLARSPLAPSVPLEGSDTVAGLRPLERARLEEAAALPAAAGGRGGGWRRHAFQRYKGRSVEQLTLEELQAVPKPWRTFWCGERGAWQQAYTVPASVEVLEERVEENFVTFLPNYLRLSLAVLLGAFYLRPRALAGAAAVAYSTYRALSRAYRRQAARQERAAAAAAGGARGRGAAGTGARGEEAPAAGQAEQLASAATTLVTWVLVATTRCLPIMLLGAVLSLVTTLLHTSLRNAPSEARRGARQPALGHPLAAVWRGGSTPAGADSRLLFRQLWAAGAAAVRERAAWAARRVRLWARDAREALSLSMRRGRSRGL
eukprot:scaffold26.g3351.t1